MESKKTFIFGVTPFAMMLYGYAREQGCGEGFVVDDPWYPESPQSFPGKVYAWTVFRERFDPDDVSVLVSATYGNNCGTRKEVMERVGAEGYRLASFVHSSAVVSPTACLGEGVIVLEGAVVQPMARIADGAVLWSNVNVCHHSTIGKYCFLAASSTILGNVTVDERCFVGAGSVVKNGIHIGARSIIGAGAYVQYDLRPDSVIVPQRSVVLERKSFELEI